MAGFDEKLRLKEQAAENIYFARQDRALIEALRRQRSRSVPVFLQKVVSGGQTGVDRAALDAALSIGLEVGGWCPLGRRAEDGPIAARYSLRETPSREYKQRTAWNVRDSDATLIVHRGALSGGTRRTAEIAERYRRPLLTLNLSAKPDLGAVPRWLRDHGVHTLNVAGPREQIAPGIYADVYDLLIRLFTDLGLGGGPSAKQPSEH
jgi:hypothetical protein